MTDLLLRLAEPLRQLAPLLLLGLQRRHDSLDVGGVAGPHLLELLDAPKQRTLASLCLFLYRTDS